jgi:hypothetical protein
MAIGRGANFRNLGGNFNVAVGVKALFGSATTNRSNNVAIGYLAGEFITSANNNTLIGFQSGKDLTTADNNIFLGHCSGDTEITLSSALIIDNLTRAVGVSATDSIIYGIMAATPAAQTLRLNAVTNITQNVRIGDTTVPTEALEVVGIIEGYGGRKKNTTRLINTDSPYAVLSSDHEIFCDTDAGAITINLPAGVNKTNYRIINTGSANNDVTVVPDGAELLTGANESRTLSDGSVIILTYETIEGWW